MINIRQVEAFRAVMKEETVTRAAQILHISQPAVSRLIKDLEYYIGFSLFEREKGRLLPTPEARALLEEVEKAFLGMEKVIDAAKDIREFRTGRLFVSCMPLLALTFLPRWVTNFSNQHPNITISLQTHSSQRVLEWVVTQQCDIGFIGMELADPAAKIIPLASGPLRLVLPTNHPLAKNKKIHIKDLDNEPFVSFGQSKDVHDLVNRAFHDAGVNRRIRLETQLSSVACELVRSGAGVSLIDPLTAHFYSEQGLVSLPFYPKIHFHYSAVLPTYRPASRLTLEFLEFIKQSLNQLMSSPPPHGYNITE